MTGSDPDPADDAERGPGPLTARRRLSRIDWLAFVVFPIVFVIAGVGMIVSGEDVVMGALAVVFFGGGAVAALTIKARDAVPLILDDDGVRTSRGALSWADIDAVYVRSQRVGGRTVTWLAVDSPVPAWSRARRANAALIGVPETAAGHLVEWDRGVTPGVGEVIEAFRARGVPVDDGR